jgi:thiol-disulfide isomerase/thioredoxin
VAVLAIGVAVISQLGKGESSGQQTQPVVVEGTALPAFVVGSESDAAVGQVPPTLEGKSFDGTPITIDPGDGQPKVVIFAAHWCPHCQAEVPRIVEWQQAGLLPDGVDVYGVSTGTTSTRPNYPPSAWLEREGWPFPTMADAADNVAAQAWGLSSYPFFVVLDADGKVVQRASGELTQEQFVALLDSVAAEA